LTPPTAYNYALNLLAARPYASRALHRKLIQRNTQSADADDVIRRLLDNGLLNDERFASSTRGRKMLSTGASKRRLTQDLYRKGIKGDVATIAIPTSSTRRRSTLRAVIERVARKKNSRNSAISSPAVLRRRLFAFLARRRLTIVRTRLTRRSLLA